jgi:CDP-paratose 2-epimerase
MQGKILITGGCGFVGSNLAIKIKTNFPKIQIVVMDNLKRRGSELNISRLKEFEIEFVHGDIRNKEDFNEIGAIDILIEAAAEPSVLAGINSTPDYVLNSNLIGTINCLNFALKNKAKFIFLSTSRVYPIKNLNKINFEEGETRLLITENQSFDGISIKGISEDFPLNGARSFYGTSKLASELLIQEYVEFYGLKAVINRCGVLTGPWQMGKIDQGVIVLWLAKHYWKNDLSYIGFGGEGKQVRDILHINDLFDLLILQIQDIDTFSGEIFNIGGSNEISVSLQELTTYCEKITGNKIQIKKVIENRSADIPIYITDNTKITTLSGWKPKIGTEEILGDVFKWLRDNENSVKKLLS